MDTSLLNQTAHRPYPLPDGSWVMFQRWHDLLFAHWPLAPELLRERLPSGVELDTFDGSAWLGVVPFRMSHVRPPCFPALPGLSAFPELNVRTYVRRDDKPGVYFFSLDAASRLAVWAARTFFHLPYYHARMKCRHVGTTGHVAYRSRRSSGGAEFVAEYYPAGPEAPAVRGSLDHFLTERYCLYTEGEENLLRCDIHHMPWPLQPASWVPEKNTMVEPLGIALPEVEPVLHFAAVLDVMIWMPVEVA